MDKLGKSETSSFAGNEQTDDAFSTPVGSPKAEPEDFFR